MVKLLDTEIRSGRLVFRVLIALFLASLSLAALYLLPSAAISYIKLIQDVQLQSLLYQLFDARIMPIGILVSLLVFVTVTLRTTKAEGPLLILLGVSLLTYCFIFLHGGTIALPVPEAVIQKLIGQNLPITVQATITANIATLFLGAICPALLIIVKGALLIATRLRKTSN